MNTLLLLAMLQVPDTLVVRVPIPAPEPVTASAPPVTVNVAIHMEADSLQRGAEAAELAVAAELSRDCGCGTPGWVYAGLVVIGAAAVGALWYHVIKTHQDPDDDDWLSDDDDWGDGPTDPPPPPPPGTQPPPPPSHPHGHQPGNSGHGKGKKP